MPISAPLDVYDFKKLDWYPHMKPYDFRIWERFIEAWPEMYKTCRYDVAVGPGPAFDPTIDSAAGTDIYKLYQRKIDVVGHIESEVDIIEVKPKAGPSAVGQVKFYRKLYIEDFKPVKLPKCVIITDFLVPGMAEYCMQEGVQLVVV